MGNRRNRGKKRVRNILITIAVIVVLILLAFIINDYVILDKNTKTNLVINNTNVTSRLKNDVIIEGNTIYISEPDIKTYFDKYITEIDNTVVTTYDKKIAEIGFDQNKMEVNGSVVKTSAHAKKGDNGETYLPISEMKDVYGIEIGYYEDTKVLTLDSTDREQKQFIVKKDSAIKSSTGIIAKTVARVKKGDYVVKVSEPEKGFTKIRTENGKIGYIKSNKLDNEIAVRQNLEEEKQVEGKVNMFWDYFSETAKAPSREGESYEGVNVVSPAFFHLDKEGEFIENVGDEGKKYIEWAHNNNYKVWPMVQNIGEGMLDTTSDIMNSYEKRKKLIESIADACVKYDLDGINIDFENMKEEDKDLYSRFIIELTPRIKDTGDVLSVDVTAPDGAEEGAGDTYSMCFDRNVIGNVADYIVFMAYDQYGVSSNKAGTTAGYNWAKTSLEKFLTTEEIKPEKIIYAIPLYTRIWTEGQDGKAKSEVVSIKDIENKIPSDAKKEWKDDVKQNYAEYQEKGATKKVWIEDEKSLKEKLSLITQNNLAGVASWQKGMEYEGFWEFLNNEINKK